MSRFDPDNIAEELWKGGVVAIIAKCQGCGQRNKVHAHRGDAKCAKCGKPLGLGTPATKRSPTGTPPPAPAPPPVLRPWDRFKKWVVDLW